MTKHLSSIWQDDRIRPYKIKKLTPMCIHKDKRFLTRDLPSIQSCGMFYPLLLYKVTEDFWFNKFVGSTKQDCDYLPPVINDDGFIWAVKMGSNRWEVANYLRYDSIDAIMFNNPNDCVKLGVWFRECDPLNNKNAPAYTGAYEYKNVI
jgi:hypothetical protein